MASNQPKRAKVVAVVLEVEGEGVSMAVLSENQKKLLTGAYIDVVGSPLNITAPIPAKIQTRGA